MTIPKIGLIGVGRFGQNHSRILSSIEEIQYAGLYDIDRDRASEIARRDGAVSHDSLEALIADIDAAVIAVSTDNHFETALACLEAGIHVLVEKPVTLNREEGQTLIKTAEDNELLLFTGHLERFNAGIEKAIDLIEKPHLLYVERHGTWLKRDVTSDVITDLMIHDLDMMLRLDKSGFASLLVSAASLTTDYLDVCEASFKTNAGLHGHFSANRAADQRRRQLRLMGDNGTAFVDMIKQTVLFCPAESRTGEFNKVEVSFREPLREEMLAFSACIRGHYDGTLATGHDGLQALEAAAAIIQAIGK